VLLVVEPNPSVAYSPVVSSVQWGAFLSQVRQIHSLPTIMRVAGGSLQQSVNKWGAILLTDLASDQHDGNRKSLFCIVLSVLASPWNRQACQEDNRS
jgi:hypothetical protein